MPDITAEEVRALTTGEYAELGKKLAKAYADLIQLQADAKDAMKEMKDGIERQAKTVYAIANQIRTGQKELDFGENGVKQAVEQFVDSIPADSSVTISALGHEPVTLHGKPKNGKAKGKAAH